MNFGLFAWGSRGDIQPFLALAEGLISAGHSVTLFAPGNFKEFIESHQVPFSPLHGNTDEILYSPEGQRVLQSGNALALLRLMQREGKKIQPLLNQDLLEGAGKVDYLLTSVLCHVWISSIAEKLGKKWGLITFSPPTTPTRRFPFAGMAIFNQPSFNLFSHKLIQHLYWTFNKKDINAFRQSMELPPLKTNILNRITENNILNLYAISPTLIPRPDDWSVNSDIIGYLFLPEKSSEPDIALQDFLAGGSAPVYIGMGSMPIPDPLLFRTMIAEILEKTSYRVILCKGWSVIDDLPEHEHLLVIDQADHGQLLPRCMAAVIHGGAGTVAACLKAGTPMVIASVFGDQPWWGAIIEKQGLGFHLPVRKATADRLITSIDQCAFIGVKTRCAEISKQIATEEGLKNAVETIEDYFTRDFS